MVDVRPMAQEKARKHMEEQRQKQAELEQGRPVKPDNAPGSGFESERQKAKRGARREAGMYTGENVEKIAAFNPQDEDDKILRVAAYCRVSTDDLEQVLSIELQKDAYRQKIKQNPKYKYCGTYVDDGVSGTCDVRRPAFMLMMKDALAGKFDMIMTKSVSRFARNLLDCIGWVRKLQECDPPINVFFEQENLNTLSPSSSLILFVLAMVAEEESHMKSEAMLLSLEWRFSRGRFMTPKLLGYDKISYEENGMVRKKLVINEDQAQTVRLMYYMLLNGSTTSEIAETLTDMNRETGGKRRDGSINTHWTGKSVACVMRNERYCGDVLARKTWTPNFHNHKSVRNTGKKNRYYQAGHHEAIVTRAQWNAAQKILNSNIYGKRSTYLPMQVIDHGALCGYISVNRSWAGFEDDEYFRVSSIAMGLMKGELQVDLENEYLPVAGHKLSGLSDESGIQRISRELSNAEKRMKAQLEGKSPEEAAQEETPREKIGYQVVSGNMFTHANDPVIRISRKSIAFNSTCISRLDEIIRDGDEIVRTRHSYVELLFNPVERMLAVRPCSKDHPNAIRWVDEHERSVSLGASAFCGILFRILDWDEDYSFRIPAIVSSDGESKALFFDLDNFIGHETKATVKAGETAAKEAGAEETQQTAKGIFYGADEDEEPQPVEDIEAIEEHLRQLQEIEKKNFGTPYFEHNSEIRLQEPGKGDLCAEARILDTDHKIDLDVITELQEKLIDKMYGEYKEDEKK